MELYRVVPYIQEAKPGTPGHPSYVHSPQIGGRFDNGKMYQISYLAADKEGAIGETFASFAKWSPSLFNVPAVPGARRALVTFKVPPGVRWANLDTAPTLMGLGINPSAVVSHNRALTQSLARTLFTQSDSQGLQYQGVQWWSSVYPDWTVYGAWGVDLEVRKVQVLTRRNPALKDAASILKRRIV